MTNFMRQWEWTPTSGMNRFVSIILRLPVLHRWMSGSILLLTFTGRKSGKQYTTPVGYFREGHMVVILSKSFRSWWRNLVEPAPVEMFIQRKTYRGTARLITDKDQLYELITRQWTKKPREAMGFGARFGSDGKPEPDSMREIASKIVAVEVPEVRPA